MAWAYTRSGIWRFSRRDAILVALAALHGAALVMWPSLPLVAVGLWWNSNTIAHNFIHRVFFGPSWMNRLFSAALSVVVGVPQTLWRDRHLAHHAGVTWRLRVTRQLVIETALVLGSWTALAWLRPQFFLLAYAPGYLAGLLLCAAQGHWEHAAGRPVSHYGRLYNFLCFNDGYHAEHHADPGIHWSRLARRVEVDAACSRWPALLRWAEVRPLEALEYLVLRPSWLQRFVLQRHRDAFGVLLRDLPAVERVSVVGGGLFPRSALVLHELLPAARITIVDSNARNLETARRFLGDQVEYRNARFVPGDSLDCDLAVIPLCLEGDRTAIYRHPPSPAVLVHDWIWRRRDCGAVVSAWLLKRVNLVTSAATEMSPGAADRSVRAMSLFAIFVAAKLIWGHFDNVTGWSLFGYFWQDLLVAIAAAGIARQLYWPLVIYAAINIPVGRVLSTPLTPAMLRAARGPLSDSLAMYVTFSNVMLVLSVLAAAAVLPRLLRLVPFRWLRWGAISAIAVLLLGPVASLRVDLRGMDRNVLTALAGPGLPRMSAHSDGVDWRESRFGTGGAEDLSRFAGSARGFNVVMVSLESTAAQYLSLDGALYGGAYEVTPNLNVLARQALVFENAYAVYPESIKGLFSVLCSRFPAYDSRTESYGAVGCRSMVEVMREAGYRTALFHSGRFDYLGMQAVIRDRGYQVLEDAGDIGGNHHSSFGVDEPATVEKMLSWIDAVPRGGHFFLTYLPIAGHHPYATPENGPFQGGTEMDQYRNALHYGDASLGTLMRGMRARGLEENTVWVVYGDHGEAFGQHAGNYGHTFFLYDENVHVPLVIAAPGMMRQERVHKVVSLVDLAPTVLELMGASVPQEYQGHSMLDGSPRMALFFADYSLGLLGLRDGNWKFEYEVGAGRSRLFDLTRDPGEMRDLSGAEKERVSWYGQVVRDWCSAQQALLRSETGH